MLTGDRAGRPEAAARGRPSPRSGSSRSCCPPFRPGPLPAAALPLPCGRLTGTEPQAPGGHWYATRARLSCSGHRALPGSRGKFLRAALSSVVSGPRAVTLHIAFLTPGRRGCVLRGATGDRAALDSSYRLPTAVCSAASERTGWVRFRMSG
ncbi:hypothetical protein GW7_09001 [Heterocephalus glaber]|uniref:Uncharacterized protein n=1 Tax=Heterocephalus glaber TaxID=10181 RepID=G5B9F9_HETGA|nr:hypothetical protein GW7_09001 [Heterocephalus glaber]